ncbi:MAG TPA: ABC transporter permease [Acetobacteraceae bacterium]|jgi:peptide/nickel transport system permease protein|nr:ABC transporter permease [Acetobacteraceae bacterium]
MSDLTVPLARWHLPTPGRIGLAIVAVWLVVAVLSPWLAPYAAGNVTAADVFAPMSRAFPLGTDYLGRDMLSRVLLGARITVGVSLAATALACFTGVTLALAAAVHGGWVDAVLSRVLDALISVPSLMFSLVIVASLGSSLGVLILTAAVIYTPGAYRTARALAVNINALDFVTVARARGEGTWFIMREEILPNMVLPVLTDFGLRFVYVVLLLSGLSFLGLGVQPPNADWGSLVRENLEGLFDGAPAVIVPAIAIATLTIGVNLLIDNLPTRRNGHAR